MVESCRPSDLKTALDRRAAGAMPFAGGTDLMVRYRAKNGMDAALKGPILFVDDIRELKSITLEEDTLIIGAALPMAIVADDPGARRDFSASNGISGDLLHAIPSILQASAKDVGAPALRQRATIGGNLANASPAGDTVAALYALNARLELRSVSGMRRVPVHDFICGPGKTSLAADELISAIRISMPPAGSEDWSYWRKVGTRRANALTKVSLAAFARIAEGRFQALRFAFGAVGPTVIIPEELEGYFIGRKTADLKPDSIAGIPFTLLLESVRKSVNPIDDQRSTAAYRKRVAVNLAAQGLTALLTKIKEKNT